MKFLDPTFWKFVVAFLAIILFVLVASQYMEDYQASLQNAPDYTAH